MRIIVVAAALLSLSACTEKRYHWAQVPYCQDGATFETRLTVLTKHDEGGGIRGLSGMRPIGDVVFDAPVLVAVVACEGNDVSADLDSVLESFSETNVPPLCERQRVVVEPVVVRPSTTTTRGYDGALPFPTIPEAELRCSSGVARTGSDPAPLD